MNNQRKLVRLLTLFLLAISLCFSCRRKPAYSSCVADSTEFLFDIAEGETIAFPLDSVTSPNTSCVQYFKDPKGGKAYLAFLNESDHSIYFYDFESRRLAMKVKLEKSGRSGVGEILNGFYIHSLDSILIVSRYLTSLVDLQGVPYYQFSFQQRRGHDFTSLPQVSASQPAIIIDGTLFLNTFPDKDAFDEDTFDGPQCIAALNLKESKIKYYFGYPQTYEMGTYGPNFMLVSLAINPLDRSIVLSFPTEQCLYKSNMIDFNAITKYGGSSYLPKLEPMSDISNEYEDYTKFYVTSPSFGSIYYDRWQKMYFRFAEYPRSELDYSEGKRWKDKSIIVFDSTLTKIAESKINEALSSKMCFTSPGGLFLAKATESEDTVYFTKIILKRKIIPL